jgi:hypothetical protein
MSREEEGVDVKTSRTAAPATAATLLLTLLVVAGALALAACGKANTSTNAPASPESTAPTQSAGGIGTVAVTRYSNRTRHTEIFLVHTDGSGLRRLTHTVTGDVSRPAWSPDGGKIAYVSGGERHGKICGTGTVWVVNADGSGQHQLDPSGYGQTGSVTGVAWSPDGRRLALTKVVPGHGELAVMDDGSGFKVVNAPREELANYYDPVWSPSGRIFFTRTGGRSLGAVCSVDPDGRGLADVTVLPAGSDTWAFENAVFSLSHDGRWLALVDLKWGFWMGGSRIGYRAANGHGREQVLLEAGRLATLRGENRLNFRWSSVASWFIGPSSWSPDGRRIAFVGGANAGMIGRAQALYVARIDGSVLRKVPNTDWVGDVAWQPQ